MKNPKVSVIIPVYNGEKTLGLCLDSVLNQTCKDYEVIVVDNNSTDKTKKIIEEFQKKNSRVKYVFESRVGLSQAKNTGWKNAKGDFVAYIDDDAIASERWVENICNAFENYGNKIFVGGKIELIFEAAKPKWLHRKLETFLGALDYSEKPAFMDEGHIVFGGNMAFPKEALEATGGFDTMLGRKGGSLISGEECLLQKILRKKGYRCLYYPAMSIKHIVAAGRLNKAGFMERMHFEGVSNARIESAGKNISWLGTWYGAARRIAGLFFPPCWIFGLMLNSDNPVLFYYKCVALIRLGHIKGLFQIKKLQNKNSPRIHLTIDDAPSEKMDVLLDYLIEKNVNAIFFCRGDYMEKRPEPVLRAIKNGFVIGNHAYSHRRFSELSLNEGIEEILKTDRIIGELYKKAGINQKCKYFRFPYLDIGGKNRVAYQKLLYKLGCYPSPYGYFIDWNCTFDTKDYKNPSLKELIEKLETLKEDDIILMHDMQYTIDKLLPICESIRNKGFIFAKPALRSRMISAILIRLLPYWYNIKPKLAPMKLLKKFGNTLLHKTNISKILAQFNNTQTDYPKDKTIHRLFEEQAERTPGKTAVVFGDRRMTYKELNEKSNQLARYLRKKGVKPDELVGIFAERSLELIVGILGILKAGGAYVPFDTNYPEERLKFMLEDTNVSLILTQGKLAKKLSQLGAKLVCLDSDWKDICNESRNNLVNNTAPGNRAYINYTSGSTGKPKGVEVVHKGVVRLVLGNDYIKFGQEHTFLHMAPISFDASTFEIWGALLNGSTCVIYPKDKPEPDKIEKIIKKNQIDTLWLTGALFNLIIDENPKYLSGISQLIIGGEVLSVPHVEKALEFLPGVLIVNGYGPTESTTFSCCYQIPRISNYGKSIPIGKPIGNTQGYILNHQLKPVPIGIEGEIFIGGDGLARGYLNRSELTKEKFISNPFREGERIYKTGDLGRWLPDGNIEFLGRYDHQIKIRGFRVELGEIEHALSRHPLVKEAAVLLLEERGNKRIAAYISCRKEKIDASEFKEYLRQKLPEYMIPSNFIFLDKLPLNQNGKIDRNKLATIRFRQNFVHPSGSNEIELAKIFKNILGIGKIGINDDFFELGGDSLSIVRLSNAIEKKFGVRMPVPAILKAGTIKEICKIIDEKDR
jgi:amino acid adenylation domain-containing protein